MVRVLWHCKGESDEGEWAKGVGEGIPGVVSVALEGEEGNEEKEWEKGCEGGRVM